LQKREAVYGYLFFFPWIIGFLIFTAYVVYYALSLSINTVVIAPEGIQKTYVGLQYYYEVLFVDTEFVEILLRMVGYILLATPIILVMSLIIAILLNQKFFGRTFFRAIFFLPVIIMSGPVMAELLDGPGAMSIESSDVLYQIIGTMPESVSTPVITVLDNFVFILWMSGVQIILFLAILQKIDPSLYEASAIDGATPWEQFWKITLPFVRPVILLNAIYTVVDLANSPNNEISDKIELHMFEQGRQYSFSSAMSWIYFVVVMVLLLVAFLIFNDWKSVRQARRVKRHG
jgi:ABC-type sugar transport system permease subunit